MICLRKYDVLFKSSSDMNPKIFFPILLQTWNTCVSECMMNYFCSLLIHLLVSHKNLAKSWAEQYISSVSMITCSSTIFPLVRRRGEKLLAESYQRFLFENKHTQMEPVGIFSCNRRFIISWAFNLSLSNVHFRHLNKVSIWRC